MVGAEALRSYQVPRPIEPAELPEDELRWSSVTLNEVLERGSRLEASVFDIEGKHARELLDRCKWSVTTVGGDNGLAKEVFVPGRVKRIYLGPDVQGAMGFLGSSEMLDVKPVPCKWLSSSEPRFNQFKVQEGWVLISCSGTVGNLAYVSTTLSKHMVSQHAIRIISDCPGYIYCFLKTSVGKALVNACIYGAVVSEIEPEHVADIRIPDPSLAMKKHIHDLVIRSYALRDESNALLDEAEGLLYDALSLPPLSSLRPRYFDKTADLRNYAVNLSELAGRLDTSYHVPIVDSITRRLKQSAGEITTIGDPRISKRVILPGRFARVYVQEGQGVPFFGGKQLFELDPANKKYLSLAKHRDRIKRDLTLTQNMTLITRSGTIGKVALVPKHWENWIANEHIIRVEPAAASIAGYLYVFLATEYGRELITHFTYGSVVDEIDDRHVAEVPVPLLKDGALQVKINHLALEANAKRTEAYHAEQEAIRITNDDVIHATRDSSVKPLV